MNKRKMPIGIQDFEDLRTNNYGYVDKTAYVYQLATEGKPYFLGRPRRFGKSLFLSTLKAYFLGKRELFDDLAIAALEKDWIEYPVFHLDLNAGDYSNPTEINSVLNAYLAALEEQFDKGAYEDTLSLRFGGLIRRAFEKTGKKVVVLIDGYDKPLVSSLENEALNERIATTLKAFYGVLKSADPCLRFVFLTGVTTYISSDLNQLRDISMLREYAGICGFSESELAAAFEPELNALALETGMSADETCAEMRRNYGGYRFARDSEGLLNPFNVLNALASREIKFYWYMSATPALLVKELHKNRFDPRSLSGGIALQDTSLANYRYGGNPIPLLYQSGYLTISAYDRKGFLYTLGFPNEEVKYGFLNSLALVYIPATDSFFIKHLYTDLEADKLDGVMARFKTFFASIPVDSDAAVEQRYQAVFYLVFMLLGQYTDAEVRSDRGRSAAVIKTESAIYVFEFELNTEAGRPHTVDEALRRIDDGSYLISYAADERKSVKVGVVFDAEKRNIGDWKAKNYPTTSLSSVEKHR
jgi:hypothetical protein